MLQSAANSAKGGPIRETHLPSYVTAALKECKDAEPLTAGASIKSLAEVEKAHIVNVYKQTGENKSKTARLLGIGLNTLRRKLASYAIK